MRKIMLVFAVGVILTLSACGSGSTTNGGTDSTAVSVDTSVAPTVDSVSAPAEVKDGSEKTEAPSEQVK